MRKTRFAKAAWRKGGSAKVCIAMWRDGHGLSCGKADVDCDDESYTEEHASPFGVTLLRCVAALRLLQRALFVGG